MSLDSLTWAAIAVIFVTLLATIWVVRRTNVGYRQDMRRMAKQYTLMLSSDDAMKLCKAIRKINPDACPGLDYSIDLASNGDAEIGEWKNAARVPTREQLLEAIRQLETSD
ncbi:MAG: hypothetical protein V3W04_04840 [Gammaproteobacteria bacterium]